MHVTIHTSQTWADTFISELNDTHVEAELRTKHIPPQVSRLILHCSCNVEFLGIANALSWLARLMTVHQIPLLSSGLTGVQDLCDLSGSPDRRYTAA